MDDTPNEILVEIFKHLRRKELSQCALTNRRFRDVISANSEKLFKKMVKSMELTFDRNFIPENDKFCLTLAYLDSTIRYTFKPIPELPGPDHEIVAIRAGHIETETEKAADMDEVYTIRGLPNKDVHIYYENSLNSLMTVLEDRIDQTKVPFVKMMQAYIDNDLCHALRRWITEHSVVADNLEIISSNISANNIVFHNLITSLAPSVLILRNNVPLETVGTWRNHNKFMLSKGLTNHPVVLKCAKLELTPFIEPQWFSNHCLREMTVEEREYTGVTSVNDAFFTNVDDEFIFACKATNIIIGLNNNITSEGINRLLLDVVSGNRQLNELRVGTRIRDDRNFDCARMLAGSLYTVVKNAYRQFVVRMDNGENLYVGMNKHNVYISKKRL